jgi:hypothetical protein
MTAEQTVEELMELADHFAKEAAYAANRGYGYRGNFEPRAALSKAITSALKAKQDQPAQDRTQVLIDALGRISNRCPTGSPVYEIGSVGDSARMALANYEDKLYEFNQPAPQENKHHPLPYSTPLELWRAFKGGAKFILHYHDEEFEVTYMDPREKVVYVKPPGLPVKVFANGRSAEGPGAGIWLEEVPDAHTAPVADTQ